ncbi:major facilitator superfamily transport protein [Alcanivorax sp. S71-1-4]|uniref:MFS transporter n=1 Tax=Alcanivorax sp. S71-1-4 TaxID=1177159 RepID=UPI0016AA9488|nr:MFS transporter [Alcanivorax sp. S71-1-4]KAF0810314.1 major facilitator superfamily transport protein [Alcanivorax sp. S71-1-4]
MAAQVGGETADHNPVPQRADAVPAYWSAVFAMTLCVFALIASEFMPVSLLTPIAGALRITEGMAGQGIAMSGAFAVLASLSISVLAAGVDRKTLLLGLTALMGLSGVLVAMAPGYVTYMAGRALIGVVIGGFWSLSAAVAMRLVPQREVPRALAVFNGGNALAMVLAAPLGAYLGAVIGWRGAFLCLVPVALIALLWQWHSLPAMPVRKRPVAAGGARSVFGLLRRPVVRLGMLAVGGLFMGQFVLFTYVRPFLETVTQVDVTTLSLILLMTGVAGVVGTALINAVLRQGFYRTLLGIPLLMAAIAVLLTALGARTGVVVGLLGAWGLIATAAPVGWWAWVARTLPEEAEAGGGLMVAVIQLSIALGATLGGLLFDSSGYQATFIASALILVCAAALALLTARAASVVAA